MTGTDRTKVHYDGDGCYGTHRDPMPAGSKSPLLLLNRMPWPTHHPQWTDATESAMYCDGCGMSINPKMLVKDLLGPCSGAR